MTRRNLFYIVIAFIVGVSVWIFYVNRGLRETQELLVEQTTQPPRRQVASIPSSKALPVDPNRGARALLLAQFQTLQQQLLDEQKVLMQKEQELRQLQENQRQQDELAANVLNESSKVTETNTRIMGFIDELNGYDLLELEINRRAGEILRDQNSEAQVLKDQLNEAIESQEALIQQIRDESVNASDLRREELRSDLEVQQQQLLELRQQRLNISASVLARLRSLEADRAQALSDISDSRNELRDEILDLRQQVYRQQVSDSKKRTSQVSVRTQILQMQRDLEKQKQQVKNVSDLLLEKNEEINLLR